MANDHDFLTAEDIKADKEDRINASMRYYKTNRAVAEVMVDTGYGKGTANRIINDRRRAEQRASERAANSGKGKKVSEAV